FIKKLPEYKPVLVTTPEGMAYPTIIQMSNVGEAGGPRLPKVKLFSAQEVAARFSKKLNVEFTPGAAEKIGRSPGILIEFLFAVRSFAPGYTKIYLPSGELQAVFERNSKWSQTRFSLPEEIPNLPEDTPSHTVSLPCPHAREAFTIIEAFEQYHLSTTNEQGDYGPSPLLELYELFQQPEFSDKQNFIDPACGPGSVVSMASLFLRNAVGGDICAKLYRDALGMNERLKGLIPPGNRTSFYHKSYMEIDYSPYDVVYLYLVGDTPELEEKLISELKPGALVVCRGFPAFERIPKVRDLWKSYSIYRITEKS
ncbi:MAG: hypothetical protein ABIA67_02775, partial [Candidatus Margulisiibacteriota bacterium]